MKFLGCKGQLFLSLSQAEQILEGINSNYAQGKLDAASVADELEDNFDLSKLLQEIPISEDLLELNDDAPVIRMINSLLKQATRDGASDIHLEAFEYQSVARFHALTGTLKRCR
jgi:general secretion pathway protein E